MAAATRARLLLLLLLLLLPPPWLPVVPLPSTTAQAAYPAEISSISAQAADGAHDSPSLLTAGRDATGTTEALSCRLCALTASPSGGRSKAPSTAVESRNSSAVMLWPLSRRRGPIAATHEPNSLRLTRTGSYAKLASTERASARYGLPPASSASACASSSFGVQQQPAQRQASIENALEIFWCLH